MTMLSPFTSCAKSLSIVAPAAALRGFERWARDRMAVAAPPAEAGPALDARLEPGDDFRPSWFGDSYDPSPRESADEMGYQIGLSGDRPAASDVFADPYTASSDGRALAFTAGRNRGLLAHARRVGFDRGLAGEPAVRPAAIAARLDAAFLAGHAAGSAERIEQERIMADHFQRLDWEHEYDLEMREIERSNREAGGWPLLHA